MIRTCPKCGDYYADNLLAFCLTDGTPLVNVNPLSESWSEGVRVVEEKENALRKQKRGRKWRRVVLSTVTMLIATMVVCVVAVNSYLYLKPEPDEVALAEPQPPATAPAALRPTVNTKPKATPVKAKLTTPAPAPTPTPTPRHTASPAPTLSQTPTETTAAAPLCSEDDRSRARESIIRRFGEGWRRKIEAERRRIIGENVPAGAVEGEATLSALEYASTFFRGCQAGVVNVRYVWRVSANVNGTMKAVNVAGGKKFACVKIVGAWMCS